MAVVLVTVAVSSAACTWSPSDAEAAGPAGDRFTTSAIRACLDKRPGKHHGLIFRTTTRPSATFVGVIMMDLTTKPARTATVGIAIYDDLDLLDAYEERARQDPTDEVVRVRNAVVSFRMPDSPNLARGEKWVHECLRTP